MGLSLCLFDSNMKVLAVALLGLPYLVVAMQLPNGVEINVDDIDPEDNVDEDQFVKDTVMSCNLVLIDIARLHDSSMDFMGTTLDFKDMPGDNTYTFSSGFSEASFTVDSGLGAVWGHVQLEDGRDFVIEPSLHICDGCHVVIEEDEEAFPPDHAETLPPSANVNEETRSNVAALLELGKMDQTTIETFSIMLYYTPEVRAAVETSGKDFNAYIELVIATTNQGYINSQIPIRAKLHCLEETP